MFLNIDNLVKRQYKPLSITNCFDMFILFLQLENKFLEERDNAACLLLGFSFPTTLLLCLPDWVESRLQEMKDGCWDSAR